MPKVKKDHCKEAMKRIATRNAKPKRTRATNATRRFLVHQFWWQRTYKDTFLPTVVASALSLHKAGAHAILWGLQKRPLNLPSCIEFRDATTLVGKETFDRLHSKRRWCLEQVSDFIRMHAVYETGGAWSDSDNIVLPGRLIKDVWDEDLCLASCPQKLLGSHAPKRKECEEAAKTNPEEWKY